MLKDVFKEAIVDYDIVDVPSMKDLLSENILWLYEICQSRKVSNFKV